jgi:cell wall-associated NlpC family hydrolase
VSVTGRLKAVSLVAAGVSALALAMTPVPVAAASGHGPTANQVTRSRHAVARRESEVRHAEASVAQAKRSLDALNVTAEVAAEAFDEARVKLHTARQAVVTAHRVLGDANAQVAAGQKRVTRLARASYESGGLSTVSAYLQPGGPGKLVSRMAALDVVSASAETAVQRLDAARVYQQVVSKQADAVAANAAAAAAVASRAKAAAAAAVAHQTTVLHSLRHQRAQLRTLLAQAKAHASRLEKARLAAIARREAAARRRAAAPQPPAPGPFSGGGGSLAGTVSAATATAALDAAESQIGKPYQWGAVGPDSYDCSGLVLWAYAQEGVHLDHWTGDQWTEGAHVSRGQLRPGDLVFFAFNTSDPSTIHHVGLYVGNGEMVDAPFTGVDVRYDSMMRPDYIGAVRPYQR